MSRHFACVHRLTFIKCQSYNNFANPPRANSIIHKKCGSLAGQKTTTQASRKVYNSAFSLLLLSLKANGQRLTIRLRSL